MDTRMQAKLAEWQAKTICTWIGANAGVWMDLKQGQRNPLVEAVQHIDIFGGRDQREAELDAIRGEKVADNWRDDPRFAPQPATAEAEASNPSGSFEAFSRMFGGGPPPPDGQVNGHG